MAIDESRQDETGMQDAQDDADRDNTRDRMAEDTTETDDSVL